MRSVLTIVIITVLVVGGIWWWHSYHNSNPYDGTVVHRDGAMENGTATMENGQHLGEEVHATPSRSDAPGTINGDPASSGNLGTQTSPITQSPNAPDAPDAPDAPNASIDPDHPTRQQPQPSFAERPNAPRIGYNATTANAAPPLTDSQAPSAPNGLRFGGSGVYQWYRQGDVTYRVNTMSGASCIIYATLEEWRKPNVYRNGCRA